MKPQVSDPDGRRAEASPGDRWPPDCPDGGLYVVVSTWPSLPGDVRKLIVSVVRRTSEARRTTSRQQTGSVVPLTGLRVPTRSD
jgi:hypothetical protein